MTYTDRHYGEKPGCVPGRNAHVYDRCGASVAGKGCGEKRTKRYNKCVKMTGAAKREQDKET